MGSETLKLKWGTLKGWQLNEDGPAMAALKRYMSMDRVSAGAMTQVDSEAQKLAILAVIDALDSDVVHLDWEGVDVSKAEARRYVEEYPR